MVAVTAEYRIRSKHEVTIPQCVTDAKSAVRWMRAHAAELGVDPDRIASGGGSVGGHLAACVGVVPGLDEPGEDASISARSNAMVLFNPVMTLGPANRPRPCSSHRRTDCSKAPKSSTGDTEPPGTGAN